MDSLVEIIITIAIIAVGSLLGKGVKSATKTVTDKTSSPQPNRQPQPHPLSDLKRLIEELSDFDDQSTVSDMPEYEYEPETTPEYAYESVAEPENTYFSYENEPLEMEQTPVMEAFSAHRPVQNEQETEPEAANRIGFDLKQAIIYQTILQNKYIAEMK